MLLCTVSTVKDSRANVERFVERNLASGADHMFVFLEGDEDDTLEFLQRHPHVTPVVADRSYWGAERPERIVVRQVTNANLVNWLLTPFPSVQWLAHLDADECLEIDRDRLLGLPRDVRCVRLAVVEAVSTDRETGEELFKKKLTKPELELLVALGVIEAPDNRHYLRGHLIGKSVVRPGLDLDMGIHRATRRGGALLEHLKAPGFRVLHYDCVSSEDFARKWAVRVAAHADYRPERRRLADAVAAVVEDDTLDEQGRVERLRALYGEYVEDPVEVLLQHDLLVRPRPSRHRHQPSGFSASELAEIEQLLIQLLEVDRRRFRPGLPPGEAVEVMQQVAATGLRSASDLRRRIEDAVHRARTALQLPALPGGHPLR